MLVVVHGNELCLGIIFACWLAGVALGAAITARFIDRIRQKLFLYLFIFLAVCLVFPFQIYTIRILRSILRIPPGEFIAPLQLLFGTLGTITPFSIFIGVAFPVACSLTSHTGSQSIGRMYIAEAIGSIVGGLLFTFFLVTRYNAFQIAAFAGWLTLFMAALFMLRFSKNRVPFALLLGLSTLYGYAFFSPLATILHNLTIEKRWQSMQPEIRLIETEDSKYQNLALGHQAGQYVLFTNGQYASVFPDEYEAAMTGHFFLVQHPIPRNVLLIGGGVEGLIGEILKHPIETLDYVELDPKLLILLDPYLPSEARQALNDPRVSILYADGRYYVKQTDRYYDIVILNLPDPTNAMLNRFYTLEFFQEVRRILNPGGIVITELSSSLHLQKKAANYAGSLYKTLRQVFPYVFVTPGTVSTYLATTEAGVLSFDPELLGNRYETRGISSEYFSKYHYDTLLQSEQIAFVKSILEQGLETFRLNTDFQPITYFYNLLLWTQFSTKPPDRLSNSKSPSILQQLHHIPAWWFFVPIAAFVVLRLLYFYWTINDSSSEKQARQFHRMSRFNCLWAIGTTGLAGIALELILIFAFQNIYGYIYQKAGLIVAVFMLGLAIGGYFSYRFSRQNTLPSSRRFTSYLLFIEITIVVFAALLPTFIRVLSSSGYRGRVEEILYMLLVGITGLLTGIEFPVASALYIHHGARIGKTAGMLDSADHIGACFGALVVGIIFIPLLGITVSCYFISTLNLSSVLFLFFTYKNVDQNEDFS